MPYVAEHEVVAPDGATLQEIAARMGRPPWRVPLVASPALRAVLWSWPASYVTVPHVHPRAEEMFHVLAGRATFAFAGEPDRTVGPGATLVARRGVEHEIRVVGDEAFVMLIVVAPNEDAPDETVERPAAGSGAPA
jgi:quercetin dioxygenase-like cupin family protein